MKNIVNKSKGIILVGAILSLGLSSCQFTNRYKSPKIDTEGMFRNEQPTDTTTIASLTWREYFKDPLLQALIVEGLNNNFDMRTATERIKIAEAQLNVAKLAYFPSLSLVGNGQYGRISKNPQTGGDKDVFGYKNNQYSLGVVASWELDIWGKINRQYRANDAQYLASLESKMLVQTSLISNIATSYYSLIALDEQLRISNETIALLKESTKTMESLMQAGMLNKAAVEQSKALLYQTEVSIPTLEYNIQQLENSISLMLGRKPGNISRSNLNSQAVVPVLAFGVPAQMLAKRPDVRSAEYNFKSAFELTNVARASFYPAISLQSGTIGYANTELKQFFKPQNLIYSLIGNLTQPIFAKGQLTANLKVAKANQEIAFINFEKAVLNASSEVSTILYQFEKSLSKNQPRSSQVYSLSNAVDYTQKLLKAGEANYTEVLTAEQNLLQAQLGQVSDKLEQLQCGVDLYRALGGGTE